jgi:hypothetical protein
MQVGLPKHLGQSFEPFFFQVCRNIRTQCFWQVCEAMEMLTVHQVIHRDLASRNILVFEFHPKIRKHVLVKVQFSIFTFSNMWLKYAALALLDDFIYRRSFVWVCNNMNNFSFLVEGEFVRI